MTKELAWHRQQAASIQHNYLVLEKEISNHCLTNTLESSQLKKNTDRLTSLNLKLTSENSLHCKFLKELRQMLAPEEISKTGPDWMQLSAAVRSSVKVLLNSLTQAQEEIQCCNLVMARQNSLLESAALMHEEGLARQALEEKEKERQWKQRLTEIKRSYESMLLKEDSGYDTVPGPQSQCRETACKCRELRRLNQALSVSNSRLNSKLVQAKSSHKIYKSDRACLLTCVCLLAGSLFTCLQQAQRLRHQKQLLLHMWEEANYQLEGEKKQEQGSMQNNRKHGTARLRIVGIAVRSVIRLQILKEKSHLLFTSSNNSLSITPCINISKGTEFNLKSGPSEGAILDRDIARWLRSERVLQDVRKCFSSLQGSLDRHTQHPEQDSTQREQFRAMVMACHQDFLNRMGTNIHVQL